MSEYKNYTLYIDESGTFFENDIKRRPSLVGGFFVPDYPDVNAITQNIIKHVTDDILINKGIAVIDLSHATDLEYNIKTYAKFCMLREIIKSKIITPIVFQQENMVSIGSNTTNYLVFLADGITKLASKLMIDNNTNIFFNIIVERRVDLDKGKGTIQKQEIQSKLQEILSIAKIRDNKLFKYKFDFDLSVASGKEGPLVLSDYICNCYYTKKDLQNSLKDEILIKDFKEYINMYYHFSIHGDNHINKLIEKKYFAEAIFEIVMRDKSPKLNPLENSLKISIKNSNELHQYRIIKNLSENINSLLKDRRECEITIHLIDRIISDFCIPGIFTNNVRNNLLADIYLYKMAALTHQGKTELFEDILEECKKHVLSTRNLDKYLIFANRCIVNYQDIYEYKLAEDLSLNVLSIFDSLTNACKEISNKIGYNFYLYKEQFAKVHGSIAMLYYLLSIKDASYLDFSRRHNRCSIENFDNKIDKIRQYQLRAHIEIESNNQNAALKYLCKGIFKGNQNFNIHNIYELDDFGWYHLLKFIVRNQIKNRENTTHINNIQIPDILNAYNSYFDTKYKSVNQISHPTFISLALLIFLEPDSISKNKYIEILSEKFNTDSQIFNCILLQIIIYILSPYSQSKGGDEIYTLVKKLRVFGSPKLTKLTELQNQLYNAINNRIEIDLILF